MRDQTNSIGAVTAIVPAILAAEPGALTVDRAQYDSLTFVLQIGAGGITFGAANRIDFTMEHSDDGAIWLPVVSTNVLGATVTGSGIVLSQRTAHPDPTTHRFGYVDGIVGQKRYVRLRAAFAGTHGTGTPIAATAILGNARTMPVAA